MRNFYTKYGMVVLVFGLILVIAPGFSQGSSRSVNGLELERQLDSHDQVAVAKADPVDRQLAQYARQIPEMGFLRLYGEGAANFIKKLPALLGSGAMNMDYQHDASQRSTLLSLQMLRIGVMAKENLPSATLFKVGAGSAFDHSNLCVITLDINAFRQDPYYSSQFLALDSDGQLFIPEKSKLIDNEKFLKLTVDHEVFHCIDAYFNGPPIKKTHDTIYSHYQNYMNEARADAFAALIFKRSNPDSEQFLEKFAALRTLSILALDFQHFTGDVVQHSTRIPRLSGNPSLKQLVAVSRAMAAEVAPAVGDYGVRIASAMRLVSAMGVDSSNLSSELEGQMLPRHDESKVIVLLDKVRKAQRILKTGYSSSFQNTPCPTTIEVPGIEIN